MLYLFSFWKINETLVSKEKNILIKNIDNEYEKRYFINSLFKYQTSSIWIIPDYFQRNECINTIIKIDFWISLEEYIKLFLSKESKDKEKFIEQKQLISEYHNIFNVILFALSLIHRNEDLIDINVDLERLDSNKYKKLEQKIPIIKWVFEWQEYINFDKISKDLVELFSIFDLNYKDYDLENFLYLWELINQYNLSESQYFKFTQLVSIIEFLIVRGQKDITQQFKLKGWIIIERVILKNMLLDNKNFSLCYFNNKTTIKELDSIYDIRSMIVHWNLKEINKEYPKKDNEYNDFQSNFFKLKKMAFGLLHEYIYDPKYIEFI